mgnify:FL=1
MDLQVWLTTSCNLRCKYCYEKKNLYRSNFLKIETARSIIKFVQESNKPLEIINFHGGEPLLNYEMLIFLSEELIKIHPDVHISFTTNGTIMNDDIMKFLISNQENFFSGITISIDGDKKTNDYNRIDSNRNGTYRKIMETYNKLKSFKLRARMTITPDQTTKIYKNVVHLHEIGFSMITHAFDYFNTEWNDSDINIIQEQYEKVLQYWYKYPELNISFADGLLFRKRKLMKCNLCYNIYYDGCIYPCTYVTGDEGYLIGDINNGIDTQKAEYLKNKVLAEDNLFCTNCSIKDYCINNRCKFMNKKITNDYYKPAPIACAIENIEDDLLRRHGRRLSDYVDD